MSKTVSKTRKRSHWAANRRPDMVHNGRSIWRMPHDRERILTEFWYSERGPTSLDGFDVRILPGYTPYPGEFPWKTGSLQENVPAIMRHVQAKHEHHVTIIVRAIDAGCDLEGVTTEYYRAEQQRWDEAVARRKTTEIDSDIPF